MINRVYVRGFVGTTLSYGTPMDFIAEDQIALISRSPVRGLDGVPVPAYKLTLTNDRTMHALSLQTFTINEIEAEYERGDRAARLREAPIT